MEIMKKKSMMIILLFTFLSLISTSAQSPELPWALIPPSLARSSTLRIKKEDDGVYDKLLPYTAHYFPQQLDHFSYQPKSYTIFYQKYLTNLTFWARGRPIFVYTGNEGDIEWFAANTEFMMDIAPKFQALLVFIEHRFYGKSMPFGKKSYKSAETLGYLNSAQAMADYAILIRSLKKNLSSESSPVVVFGGSYGGMLAAWFRLKYPHIAIGALASSAPILQFDDIVPWSSFYDGVSQDFKDESLNCFDVIKRSWDELNMVSTKKGGISELNKTFRTCRGLKSVNSVRDWLWEAFVYTAMVDYPTNAKFIKPLPANPVKQMCRIIDGLPPAVGVLTKVFSAASLFYNYTGSQSCFDIGHETDTHGLNGWDWQACTEMVMPMTITNQSMFPPATYDYEQFGDRCMEKYGVRPRPHWITTEYGGYNIKQVLPRFGSNIIFSNGLRDPWSRGGVLHNLSPTIVALVTQKGAHHLDLRSATKQDPSWLKEQRKLEVKIIKSWIDKYYSDLI
ncbi:putative serine protease EDA2 [Apostasia shenzhenica]|uniref:Putative serine protease EDA2 n=1 Tax=Apostasia shenzhenica TaxID=1088818 RepID=A0A2I0ABE5_9ASPA|nr:putative serine protease EDA2 [Apostasia shenzhenica]